MGNALISIKPDFVNKILSGEKTIELRSRVVRIAPGTQLWIYATLPIGCIQAVAEVERVSLASPRIIWANYFKEIGISKKNYDEYVKGRRLISAIKLSSVQKIQPSISLTSIREIVDSFQPPQFFNNLHTDNPVLSAIYQIVGYEHLNKIAI